MSLDWSKSLLKTGEKVNKQLCVKHLLHGAHKWEEVMEMCPVRAKLLPSKLQTGVSLSLSVLGSGLTEVSCAGLSSQKIPGCLLCTEYCASGRARVMLHERRLKDSHEFQESGVSKSLNGVSGLTYTPTDTNTHINHVCR